MCAGASRRRPLGDHSQRAFITKHPNQDNPPRRRSVKVDRLINDTAKRRWIAGGTLGQVRWRVDLLNEDDEGKIERFYGALPLADVA
jgi:hypothetical protein